jgi:hypothetical protein
MLLRRALLLLVALALVALTGPAAQGRGHREGIRALERQGRFATVLERLRHSSPTGARRRRVKRLETALRTLQAASVYTSFGRYSQAEALLGAAAKKLDPVTDVYLERVIYGRLAKVQALHPPPTAKTSHRRGFWGNIGHSFTGVIEVILKWLLVGTSVLAAIGAVALLRWIYRRLLPRRGRTTIAIADLDAEDEERNLRSHLLTRELIDVVYSITGSSEDDGASEIDERRDLDGTTAAPLRIADGTHLVEPLVPDSTPVKVGPVSISPSQLVSFARWCVKRRFEHEITGTYSSDSSGATLTVERVSSHGRAHTPQRWHAANAEDDARTRVIHDVATQLAVALGGSYVSSNWRSVREYLEAQAQLKTAVKAENRQAALELARAGLQRSLEADSHNLLARFNLAAVLRALGRNRDAATNFDLLQQLVANPDGVSSMAGKFIARHPELLYVVEYNLAVALSKLPEWESHNSARTMLALLVARLSENQQLLSLDEADAEKLGKDLKSYMPATAAPSEEERRRLELLCRAAWASTLVFRVERAEQNTQDGHDSGRLRGQQLSILEKLEEVKRWLAQPLPSEDDRRLAIALNQAQATVENACGRVRFLLGRRDAQVAVERALVLLPEFGDAHVNLASILLARRSAGLREAEEIEHHLQRALEISPRDPQALLLLGQLYEHRSFERNEEAAACYRQLPDDAIACFRLGQLLSREGKLSEAVTLFSRSLSLLTTADYRAKRFVEAVLELAARDQATDARLEEARVIARRLAKKGVRAKLQQEGQELLTQLAQWP